MHNYLNKKGKEFLKIALSFCIQLGKDGFNGLTLSGQQKNSSIVNSRTDRSRPSPGQTDSVFSSQRDNFNSGTKQTSNEPVY